MTTNAQVQFADGNEVNLTWHIPEAETLRIKDDSTIRYAAAAVAFGLVFGVALAATAGSALVPTSSPNQASTVSSTAVVAGSAASPSALAMSHHSQAANPAIAKSSSAILPAALKTSVSRKFSAAHRRHTARRVFAKRVSFTPHLLTASLTTAPAPPPVTVSMESRPAPATTASFFMEGDATVADFDSSSGTIQTDEGKSFLIGMPAGVGNGAPWQDYHRNVHYRCDQSGNCTISGAGVVVPNAKLT
jgi:hypothetical protein